MCGGVRQGGVGDVLAEGAGGMRAAGFAAHIGVGYEPADGACHGVFRVRAGEAGFVAGFGEQGGSAGSMAAVVFHDRPPARRKSSRTTAMIGPG